MSFFRTMLFYITDLGRRERLNIGLVFVCQPERFIRAKFVSLEEYAARSRIIFGSDDPEAHDGWFMADYANAANEYEQRKEKIPWEEENLLQKLYGESHYMSCVRWESASSGLLAHRTPQAVFEHMVEFYLGRPVLP